MRKFSTAFKEDIQLTRNLANTSDASHTVVPWCLELGSYSKLNCQILYKDIKLNRKIPFFNKIIII
jgi:hypothetical protein